MTKRNEVEATNQAPFDVAKTEDADTGTTTGIINPVDYNIPSVPAPNKSDFHQLAKGLFLPRLTLEGSSSTNVKNDKVPKGTYIITTGRDTFEQLGPRVDVVVLSYRAKALDIRDEKNIIASYDKASPTFQELEKLAKNKVRKVLFGLEFLLWVPAFTAEVKFVSLYMGSATSRRASAGFSPMANPTKANEGNILKRQATLGWEKIVSPEHIWEGITIIPCNTPLHPLPTPQQWLDEVTKFLDLPKGDTVETVEAEEEESATAGGRER